VIDERVPVMLEAEDDRVPAPFIVVHRIHGCPFL
jgi:hypothetical protein